MFRRKKVVYYPGTTLAKFFPNIVLNWKSVLSDFGLSFTVVNDLNPGWALWDQGYHDAFAQHKAKLIRRLRKEHITTIYSSSPEAVYMFNTFFEVKAVHTTELVYQNLQKIQAFNSGEACFHDNSTQVRRNKIINEPRDILQRAGFTLKEFEENKENTQCLGTSTGLINNSPRLATKLALHRIRKAPAKIIITDSPEDYVHLRRSTSNKILELSEVLVEI